MTSCNVTKPKDESERSDLRMLYQVSVSDVAFFKQQQWRVTNSAIVSYVAIIAAASILKTVTGDVVPCERFVGHVLVVTVAATAVYVLYSLRRSLAGARDCIDAIKKRLDNPAFDECYEVKWAKLDRSKRDLPFPHLFYAFVLVGALVASWILYRGYWPY